jgi:hypothetical protein
LRGTLNGQKSYEDERNSAVAEIELEATSPDLERLMVIHFSQCFGRKLRRNLDLLTARFEDVTLDMLNFTIDVTILFVKIT